MTKSKNISDQQQELASQPTIYASNPLQAICADRILNVGFGPVVSKLTLGLEVGPNSFTPFANVVIPTIALLEVIESLQKAINENDQVNAALIDKMDEIKAHLEKQKK